MERLLSFSGITPETPIVLYGDNNNWFAAFAFWLLRYYGHANVALLDGGRRKWEADERPLTTEQPRIAPTEYRITNIHNDLRVTRDEILAAVRDGRAALVDVRSPDEYTGQILAPPGLAETAQRGGHIPGAINVPWSKAVREDGTFRSRDELRDLYQGVRGRGPITTYCRIGERSSHTWFVLKELLREPDVRNYDGSWTEYGNLIGAPIATGPQP
jgi:thiosulfate/3-mercaptopyruvate sulfurtransferase